MDILIKNMEMKDYPQSITINPDGSVIKDTFGLHRPMNEWKAIELPEHGDLIDSKELFFKFNSEMRDIYGSAVNPFCIAVADAPTVLEASSKTDAPQKARICPHYQGVCGLDEEIVCYCSSSYEMCDKYREASE